MIHNIAYILKIARGTEATKLHLCVRLGQAADIPSCKPIADQHRDVLGFLTRGVFAEAVEKQHLLVADLGEQQIVGFVRFNHRKRGTETAIYDIGVDQHFQRQGIGRALVGALANECRIWNRDTIALRCPEGVPANDFYCHIGFQHMGILPGRKRRLMIWQLPIETIICSL